jgi:uncharacterized membrane protein
MRALRSLLRLRTYWAPVIVGAALMAAIDEIVFHQILGWHHFYDGATPLVGLISDGILHSAELFGVVGGFFLIAREIRDHSFRRGPAIAGTVVGLGLFQLWDGVIDHKVLRIHQVRYDVDLLPYDLAWIGGAVLILIVGILLTFRAAREVDLDSSDRSRP